MAEPTLTWIPILAGLTEVADTVVVYDRAGIGLSGPAHGEYSGRTQIADLAAVIKDVSPAPCVVVGHSLGGWLAQALAWEHAELLAGLVLLDPSHEDVYLHIPDDVLATLNQGAAAYASMSAEVFIASRSESWQTERAQISEDAQLQALIIKAWHACFATDDRVRAIYEEETAGQRDLPWARRLRETRALPKLPSVVLSATTGMPEEMRTVFTMLQQRIASALGAEHENVAESGHYIHRDRPKAVVDATARVIDQVRAKATLSPLADIRVHRGTP